MLPKPSPKHGKRMHRQERRTVIQKMRIMDGPRLDKGEYAVVVDTFNVYTGDSIDGRDRQRIERMCRYLATPPIAMDRLTEVG